MIIIGNGVDDNLSDIIQYDLTSFMKADPLQWLKDKAFEIRKSVISMAVPRESHHIGCALSIIEILTVLYYKVLRINPAKPNDPRRDIFILSKGHAGSALYATLAHRGFFEMTILDSYDQDDGMLSEHVTKGVPGVEFSTGSLGHGLPVGTGYAIAALRDGTKRKVFVLVSDGDLNEGSNWEAIMFAGHHKLDNLVVIMDYNKFQGYGSTKEVLDLTPYRSKLAVFRWNTYTVNGHSLRQLTDVFKRIAQNKNRKPHFVIAHTIKGRGIPYFEGKFTSHYQSIDAETKEAILKQLLASSHL